MSVRGKVGASEVDVPDKDLEDHIVSWPLKWPKGAKGVVAAPSRGRLRGGARRQRQGGRGGSAEFRFDAIFASG